MAADSRGVSTSWHASPVLGVQQVRKTAENYRDVLGFYLDPVDGVFQPSADEPGGVYAIVKRPGAWIHIQIRRDDSRQQTPVAVTLLRDEAWQQQLAQRPAFERDVYIYVDDVDSLFADLQRRGATILSPLRMAPHGIREFVVEDLNGYRLAFGRLAST